MTDLDGDDYLAVLRSEFEAEEGTFLRQLWDAMIWDEAAFARLAAAMAMCCEPFDGVTRIDRWMALGFWHTPIFVRDWTTRPNFPREPEPDYYDRFSQILESLAWRFFFDGYLEVDDLSSSDSEDETLTDGDYPALRSEFDAEEGSFLGRLRPQLHWDEKAFAHLIGEMVLYCAQTAGQDKLDRWATEAFWYTPHFVRQWTTHPHFPRDYAQSYYTESYERLYELARWFFFGYPPDTENPSKATSRKIRFGLGSPDYKLHDIGAVAMATFAFHR